MRLLHLQDTGGLTLSEHHGTPPPYAILSHTWGSDQDEVSYRDLVEGCGKNRLGYSKLLFCGRRAAHDGLQYFWVDTCCIDKSSSAELSEAINSMFAWYQNAERCYVYLPDVSDGSHHHNSSDSNETDLRRWKPAFRKSRWFTRGWTLQELLAPKRVEFFSKEELLLGDKESLKEMIHEITNIPLSALAGKPLRHFSLEVRFSWAASRDTKREEDIEYCLLGIFNVHLPLLYGEGRQNASRRLKNEIHACANALTDARGGRSDTGRDQRVLALQLWLPAPDPTRNYQNAFKQRQGNTGLWLLHSERYISWKTEAASILWLHGIPGSGKTVLSAIAVQDVLKSCHDGTSEAVAYFYFDFNDAKTQDNELMLRSIVCQLSYQSADVLARLERWLESHEHGQRRPSVTELLDMLREIVQNFSHVYVVLDALDESNRRPQLLNILGVLAEGHLDRLHLLVTSRRERDIETSLENIVRRENRIGLETDMVDADIRNYVQQRLSDDTALSKWAKDIVLRQEIEAALIKGSRGMFRWAACQLDTLGRCRSRAMLRRSLAELPPTLDKTYDRILSSIAEPDAKYALRILQWLTFALRPLTVDEIAESVAIDDGRIPTFDREEVLEDPMDVLDICCSLVTIAPATADTRPRNPPKHIVKLAHYSVKEYLLSEIIQKTSAARFGLQLVASHATMARACLDYLLQFQSPLTEEALRDSKLARYSAEYWMAHFGRAGGSNTDLLQAALLLSSSENAAYLNWIRISDPERPWAVPDLTKSIEDVPLPLYYMSLFGLVDVVKLLVDTSVDVNTKGGFYGNALVAASGSGHEETVNLLLQHGANVNAAGEKCGTALDVATMNGHTAVVDLLLANGAQITSIEGDKWPPLDWPSNAAFISISKLLIDKGLSTLSDAGGRTALMMAASYGPDINAQSLKGSTALDRAVRMGHQAIAEKLVQHGATPQLQNIYGFTALSRAAYVGSHDLLSILLAAPSTQPPYTDYFGRTLLWWAAAGGNLATTTLLLSNQHHNANIKDKLGRSPLDMAIKKGHVKVAKLLNFQDGECDIDDPGTSKDASVTLTKDAPDDSGFVCDLCLEKISITACRYHCSICAQGDWDMCSDCFDCAEWTPSCMDGSHVLVKRIQRDGIWLDAT
ncbi:hypothetical protein T440DRAFT_460188 [Plenodomus tracheiphilus IPT5]|uniref:Uncharacterized protein n=1 Tax=Plenodomus tracheiphilus IPT5 TaxID=1408161 RepID=A0A6A7AR56_9PLEO|nr:hypothetical protein T440DRAFT_460188 [Plenodomus tracheiphilus IPT5]